MIYIVMKEDYRKKEVLRYMMAVCQIVRQFHTLKPYVINRDIKPDNIIVTKNNEIYLIDFHIARHYNKESNNDTKKWGTEHFAAPEQYGFGQSDRTTDIYGIGATMNYLLCGQYRDEMLCQGKFKFIIRKCTMLNKKDRYQSVYELYDDLQQMYLMNYSNSKKKKKPNKLNRDEKLPDHFPTNTICQMRVMFQPWKLPGFRTNTLWKKAIALFVYMAVALICCLIPISVSGIPLIGAHLYLQRMYYYLMFLMFVLISCNYLRIRDFLPSRQIKWKWLRQTILIADAILVDCTLMGLLVFIENIIDYM